MNSSSQQAILSIRSPRSAVADNAIRHLTPVALFLAANVFALIVAWMLDEPRGFIINFDYAAPALLLSLPITSRLSSYLRLTISVALFLLYTIDLTAFGTRFYFGAGVSADAIFSMVRFIEWWPWKLLLPIGAAIATVSVVMARLVPLSGDRARSPLLMSILLLAIVVDMAAGRNRLFQTGSVEIPNIVSSPSLTVIQPIFSSAMSPQVSPIALADAMKVDLGDSPPAHILSVAVESLGILSDTAEQESTLAPLLEGLAGQYRLRVSRSREYRGGTLSAEIRELCALRTLSLVREDNSFNALQNCLPHQLAFEGYETIGIHGNDGSFYNRSRVYPGIGFNRTLFKKDLIGAGAQLCTDLVFSGVCDADTFHVSLSLFHPDRRQFIHIMSLDTHLPLPVNGTKCRSVRRERELCIYKVRMGNTLGALALAVRQSSTPPDLIIVYGDHTPPFNEQERTHFRRGVVPYLRLERIKFADLPHS